MNSYELMCIYPLDDDKSKAGIEAVKATLAEFGSTIEKETPFGDRDLTYEVKKQNRGRFVLYNVKVNPAKIPDFDRAFHLNANLLKYMFVRLDADKLSK